MQQHQQTRRQLSNIYVCGRKSERRHILPSTELILSSAVTFEVTPHSIYFLTQAFNYSRGNWFKFLLINDNIVTDAYDDINANNNGTENDNNKSRDSSPGKYRMFICNGSALNRHSIIYINAIAYMLSSRGIESHPNSKYYPFLKAYNDIFACKESKKGVKSCKHRLNGLNRILNRELKKHFKCMKVISAGSGTVFENIDGTSYNICLNTKSGHYKPSLQDVKFASSFLKNIVEKIECKSLRDRVTVSYQYKSSSGTIRKLFGDRAESKVGICIPKKNKTIKIKQIKIRS